MISSVLALDSRKSEMAQFTVRNIEEDVKQRLKERALNNGTSLEEEVRSILRAAALGEKRPSGPGLGTRISSRFAKMGLLEPLPEFKGQIVQPADFEQ
jgi:antitoxin FitA